MNSIISYLLLYIQQLLQEIKNLQAVIAKYHIVKACLYPDSQSPDYQKFKTDVLPRIRQFHKQDYQFLLEYYLWKYGKSLKPVKPHKTKPPTVPKDAVCPRCGAPHEYLYDNNGGDGQFQCKVCAQTFISGERVTSPLILECPYCQCALTVKRDRKFFRVHTCMNPRCSYYQLNLLKLPSNLPKEHRYLYKLHYVYREFTVDFFKIDLKALPSWATSFQFRRNNAHIMGLCLTYHVNLGLSLRKTAQAMQEIHNIAVSHTMIANYAKTAAILIKPFVDSFDYQPNPLLTADETYIKIKGKKAYVWVIMDAVTRSILGHFVSMSRDTGACILAMRLAFDKFKVFPEKLRFVADGYSAYPLAAQQFLLEKDWHIPITQVIGLENRDDISKEFRPFKQIIERFNRTFKANYRLTCGYDNEDGAHYGVNLFIAYYNFLRPHDIHKWKKPLNSVPELLDADNMPAKWQILIRLGQQVIMQAQNEMPVSSCS